MEENAHDLGGSTARARQEKAELLQAGSPLRQEPPTRSPWTPSIPADIAAERSE